MARLVRAIHGLIFCGRCRTVRRKKLVDGRNKSGRDELGAIASRFPSIRSRARVTGAPKPKDSRSTGQPWAKPVHDGLGLVARTLSVVAIAIAVVTAVPAFAVEPDEILSDPALEARARDIGRELRCLVCQNQSIDDSAAPLARDLRILVRQRLTAGDTDDQAIRFVAARYGEFVLLKPPFEPTTWALWLGPPALLAIGIGAIALQRSRRRHVAPAAPLSDAERSRLDALMKDIT